MYVLEMLADDDDPDVAREAREEIEKRKGNGISADPQHVN